MLVALSMLLILSYPMDLSIPWNAESHQSNGLDKIPLLDSEVDIADC